MFSATMRSRILVVEGLAEPPKASFTLKPLYRGGLWLAVIITPAPAQRSCTAQETAGVGAYPSESQDLMPFPAAMPATRSANSRERKRRS